MVWLVDGWIGGWIDKIAFLVPEVYVFGRDKT